MNKTECAGCLKFGRLVSRKTCPGCHRCVEHSKCRCVSCGLCRVNCPPKEVCPSCNTCKKHHVAAPNIKYPHRVCDYINSDKPITYQLNQLPRTLGCEYEVANTNGFQGVPSGEWTWARDGSVRPSGLELVTDRMRGDDFIYITSRVLAGLKDYGCAVNSSCGFHVHVDAVDFNMSAIRRLWVGFATIQHQLYGTLVHPSRASANAESGVHFCAPLEDDSEYLWELMERPKGELRAWLCDMLYGCQPPTHPGIGASKEALNEYRIYLNQFNADISRKRAHKYENNARRSALNLHSWMMRGTVEFRLKEGIVDPANSLNWPLWCGWFVEHISKMEDKGVCGWIKDAPPLLSLCESWYKGSPKPPTGLREWVRGRCAKPQPYTKPPKQIRLQDAPPALPPSPRPPGLRLYAEQLLNQQMSDLNQQGGLMGSSFASTGDWVQSTAQNATIPITAPIVGGIPVSLRSGRRAR